MKKRIKLPSLKVKSFITTIDDQGTQQLKGGDGVPPTLITSCVTLPKMYQNL